MRGAFEYYNTIKNASHKELGGLKSLGSWYGGDSETYVYDKFIFVTSSHARGKCFHIFLIEDSTLPKEQLKNNAFEVYGVLGGQPGWTEFYGWIHKGKWVSVVNEYLQNLKKEIEEDNFKKEEEKKKKELNESKEVADKVNKFNKIFE